jgi:hypothetical protein
VEGAQERGVLVPPMIDLKYSTIIHPSRNNSCLELTGIRVFWWLIRFPPLREDMNVSVAPKGTSHKSTIAYASLLRGRCHLHPASARHSGRKPPGQRDVRDWCQARPLRRVKGCSGRARAFHAWAIGRRARIGQASFLSLESIVIWLRW